MRTSGRIGGEYAAIDYHQFTLSPGAQAALRAAGILTWPVTIPLALLSRLSDFVFRTCSEALAAAPYVLGVIARQEFYRFALARCGRNVSIGFGTVFVYRDVSVGDNALIGSFNVIHHCDFGSYVLTADGCQFLSGAKYHNFDRTDVPMALQGGKVRRIRVGEDCWIGAGAIVMDDVGEGAVVGAGSVVISPVEPYAVVAGNPARVVKRRGGPAAAAEASG